MPEHLNKSELNRGLVLRLLRQSAKERAVSQRWSINTVVLIGCILVIVLILDFQPVDTWIVAIIAFIGLVALWLFGWVRAKKLEKVFYQQELSDYGDLLPNEPQSDYEIGQKELPLEIPLTSREIDILSRIGDGKTNKEIARAFNVNESSIKNQVSRILHKLDVSNRTEAVLLALSHGWVKKPDNNG